MKARTSAIMRKLAIVAPTATPAIAPLLRPLSLVVLEVAAEGIVVEVIVDNIEEGRLEAAAAVLLDETISIAVDLIS